MIYYQKSGMAKAYLRPPSHGDRFRCLCR